MQKLKYLVCIKILLFYRHYLRIDQKEIVLVTCCMKPRILKIAYALKKRGYRVVLLLDNDGKESIYKSDIKFFDKIITFASKEELYIKCLHFKPLVYHLFSEAGIKECMEYIIQNKDTIGKIVYDQYDVFKGLSRYRNKAIENREKFCFENADGLCCRSFETQYLKHKYNYHFNGKRILFLDYCWNNLKNDNTKKDEGNNLKLIYGGRLLPSKSKDVLEGIEWEGFQYIADISQKYKAYFVVVPSKTCNYAEFPKFIDLDNNNSYFKLKETMSVERLIKYESKMDYGIDCVEFESKMDEYESKFGHFYDYKYKAKYYATNKYFDYIDAGIPAIYGRKNEMFGRYLARYGGAVFCSLDELPSKMEWLKKTRNINKEKVKKAREIFSIENQIDRLIDFYHEI